LRQPLIVSAGMPRAGSGWYYNLLHDLVVSSGGQNARQVRTNYHLELFLTEVNCNISTLSFYRIIPVLVPTLFNNKFVVKTHAGPTLTAHNLIRNKRLFVIYIYRDPRAALLSAYEYGQRAIENKRPNAFSHLKNLEESAEFIRFYINIWDAWSGMENVLVLRYEDLLSNYHKAIEKTALFLNLDLANTSSPQVIEKYQPGKGDPGQIGTHFSQGEAERFRSVFDPDQLEHFNHIFEPFLPRMGYEK
jgi:hypothetical protein